MNVELPLEGAANEEVRQLVHATWIATATEAKIDLSGFDPEAPLSVRLAWAAARGLLIGAILSRYSSKMQHSTTAQVKDDTVFAARNRIYVPPEYVCVDEAVSGSKQRRAGLERMTLILRQKLAKVLLVFKVSRLFRKAYKGLKFFTEEVVENGLRAISITQGIDTADEKIWKPLAYMHGMCDEMLLDTIADHVRSGQRELFVKGYVTGALTVGYEAEIVPNAPPTKNGKPRTQPKVNAAVAKMILQHYQWIDEGMSIQQGWRRWVRDGGAKDRRSKGRYMGYYAYRHMLSNPRYTGLWAFGRLKNLFVNRLDYTQQTEQPENQVSFFQCEDLRIVPDDLYRRVQKKLAIYKDIPRGPRKEKASQLWDLVTDLFRCEQCSHLHPDDMPVRFHMAGANGQGMRCKNGIHCPCATVIRRQEAVQAICAGIQPRLVQDADLVTRIIESVQCHAEKGDAGLQQQLDGVLRQLKVLKNRHDDLLELAGGGSEEDRAETKAKVQHVRAERSQLLVQKDQLEAAIKQGKLSFTAEQVRTVLQEFSQLLTDGACGRLGPDVAHRAVAVFRLLVDGYIWVSVQGRPGRKQKVARAHFRTRLLHAAQEHLQDPRPLAATPSEEIEVWLRKPPQRDLLAPRAHQLIDIDGHSFRSAAEVFQEEGHNFNSGVVWQLYHRYYQMIGQPVPPRRYNNGRPRAAG